MSATLRADARRNVERVLDAAISVLGENPNASIEQIAAASGVHRSTVYRHFPAREQLIDALVTRALGELRVLVGAAGRGELDEPRFRRLCADAIAAGEQYTFLLAHIHVSDIGPDPVGLVQVMRRYQRAHVLRADQAPTWLAAAFTALATALFEGWATWSESPAGAAALLADTFLAGAGAGAA